MARFSKSNIHMDWYLARFQQYFTQVNDTESLWWYVNVGSNNGLVPMGNLN